MTPNLNADLEVIQSLIKTQSKRTVYEAKGKSDTVRHLLRKEILLCEAI